MMPTNVRSAKFHQPITLGKERAITSINLDQENDGKKYQLRFSGGFLVITSIETSDRAFVGLANICYLIADEETENKPVTQKKVKKS